MQHNTRVDKRDKEQNATTQLESITASSETPSKTYVKTPYMMRENPAKASTAVSRIAIKKKINHSVVLMEEEVTSNQGFRFFRANMTISVTMRMKQTAPHAI
jgi:hypothetical protein